MGRKTCSSLIVATVLLQFALVSAAWAEAENCEPAMRVNGHCPDGQKRADAGYTRPLDSDFDNDQCTPVDLDAPGGTMEHVAIRNQGTLGTCFAETSSELVDAYRFSHGATDYAHQTSSTILALHSGKITQGTAYDALSNFDPPGSCNASRVIDSLGNITYTTDDGNEVVLGPRRQEFFKTLERYYDEYRQGMGQLEGMQGTITDLESGLGDSARYERAHHQMDRAAEGLRTCLRELNFPAGVIPSIDAARESLRQDDPNAYFLKLLEPACAGSNTVHPILPPVVGEGKWPGYNPTSTVQTASGFMRRIDDLVTSKNSQPVAVDFCANILRDDRNYVGSAIGFSCKRHSAVISGRKRAPDGRCMIKLRNSWGPECDYYGYLWNCDHGSVWVDAKALFSNAYMITHFGAGK